jgi:hypothetical protein
MEEKDGRERCKYLDMQRPFVLPQNILSPEEIKVRSSHEQDSLLLLEGRESKRL